MAGAPGMLATVATVAAAAGAEGSTGAARSQRQFGRRGVSASTTHNNNLRRRDGQRQLMSIVDMYFTA